MKLLGHFMIVFLVLVSICLVFPRQAYAYLDPGMGSYIFQLIMAGLLGASLMVKIYWMNIKKFFSERFGKERKREDSDK